MRASEKYGKSKIIRFPEVYVYVLRDFAKQFEALIIEKVDGKDY